MMPPSIPTFADVTDPLDWLTPPGDYSELATESVLDALPRVVGWLNDAVRWVTRQFGHEIDLVGWLLDTIGGDWSELLTLGDVWENLAYASASIGTNLRTGRTDLDPHWEGNAAQAFEAHITKWDQAFEQNRSVCLLIRDQMSKLATAGKEFLQAAIDVIEMVASFVSGGLVVIVMNAADIADGVIKGYRVYKAVRKSIEAASSVFEAINAVSDTGAPDTRVSVPGKPYGGPDSPGTM